MAGLLDQLMLNYRMPGASPWPAQPNAAPNLTPEEIAAASQPAMFGSQPMMGGLADMVAKIKQQAGMAQPFARGTTPVVAPNMGAMGDVAQSAFGGPASGPASGPPAVTSLDGGGPIPLPVPRPASEMSSRGVATQAPGAPLSLAPPAPIDAAAPGPTAAAAGGGFRMPSSAFLLALGGGLAGAPSFGQALRRGFSNAAGVAAQDEARATTQQQTAQNQADVYRSLIAKGVPPQDAIAALRSPAILKEISDKYFGAGKEAKAPTTREIKLPDGNLQQQQWNAQKGDWDNIGGPVKSDDKRRNLSVGDITKLSDEAGKFRSIERYVTGFKDAYAGDISDTYGEAKNWSGRNNPLAGKDSKDRAAWWQDYSQYRNAIRHDLFGSALTAPEKAAFLESDITPGMQPDMIRRNLARQQEIVTNALKRKGGALIEAGTPRNVVAKAYGMDPSFFEVTKPAAATGKTKGGISFSVMPDANDEED